MLFFSWVLFGRRKEDDFGACEMGDGMRMCVEVVGDCGWLPWVLKKEGHNAYCCVEISPNL